jgi:hypothetical protein
MARLGDSGGGPGWDCRQDLNNPPTAVGGIQESSAAVDQ